MSDPLGLASGALDFDLRLTPGATREVALAVPLDDHTSSCPAPTTTHVATLVEGARREWTRQLDRVERELPPAAAAIEQTLRIDTLGYILVNRDGPALQPGSRTYARSWIRDGAMTSTALLQMGITASRCATSCAGTRRIRSPTARSPAASTARGADPMPEHDSNGAVPLRDRRVLPLHARRRLRARAVAERHPRRRLPGRAARAAHDAGLPRAGQERLLRPAAGIDQPRGLLVASGALLLGRLLRAARPARTRSMLAHRRGRRRAGARATPPLRDELPRRPDASIDRTIARHGIDYLPGSVELGDFDPTLDGDRDRARRRAGEPAARRRSSAPSIATRGD